MVADEWRARLEKALPDGVKIVRITQLSETNLMQVELTGGRYLYVLPGGEYFMIGDLARLHADGRLENLSDRTRHQNLVGELEDVADEAIRFPAQGEVRAVVYVFTDTECGYCREFHRQIVDYNALGIEVRYLAWPRTGPGSNAYRKTQQAWCAKDPQRALTDLKRGRRVGTPPCELAPVEKHYRLGLKFGVRGTPVIVTSAGEVLHGYHSPQELMSALHLN